MNKEFSVELKDLSDLNVLSIRRTISLKDFDNIYSELFAKVEADAYTITGAPLAIYHDEEFNPDSNDTELAVPVKENTSSTRVISGGLYATTICREDFSQLPKYYAALVEWINENNYMILDKPFEQYLNESLGEKQVEICFKVAQKS